MQSNADILQQIIRNRRSVKPEKFNGTDVPDEIIQAMLEAAQWAPTHGMTQPWRFFIFSGAARKRFAEFQAEGYRQKTSPEKFLQSKYDTLLQRPMLASHVICIGMEPDEKGKIPETEEICAVACAVQNMLLSAEALGIGAYWSTGGMTYSDAMKPFLGLSERGRCLGVLYIGHFDQPVPVPERSDISTKVQWNR